MPLVVGGQKVASLYADIGAKVDTFKAGAATVKSDLKGLAGESKLTNQQIGILAGGVTAFGAILADAYVENGKYVESVRDLALVSGAGAEETSRFIQVLDDYQLTQEDALAATKKLKDQGLTPTIDTLAKLADEYKTIQDPAEKMKFIQENLGKGGVKWVNILNQESSALRQNAADVNKLLIVTDAEVKMHEVQRLAIDNVKDSLEGYKMELGQNISNVAAWLIANGRASEIMKEHNDVVGVTKDQYISYKDALAIAIAEQLQQADASLIQTQSIKDQEEALKNLSKANADIINDAIDIQSTNDDYVESQNEIVGKIGELQKVKEGYYSWEQDKIDTAQQEIDDLSQKYADNAEEYVNAVEKKITMAAIEQIAMQDGVAGYSEAEFEKAKAILETTDIATAAAFDQQQAQAELASAVADGRVPVEEYGALLDSVMADGVVSVNEVRDAISNIPTDVTTTVHIYSDYSGGDLPTDSTQSGSQTHAHAQGGSWTIPAGYGVEGYPMGGGHTASAGETVTITPKNQQMQQQAPSVDYKRLERAIRDGMMAAT